MFLISIYNPFYFYCKYSLVLSESEKNMIFCETAVEEDRWIKYSSHTCSVFIEGLYQQEEIFIPLSISTTASLEAAWFGLSSCMRFCLSWGTRLSASFCSSSLRKSGMRWKTTWFELIFRVQHRKLVSHHALLLPLLALIHSSSFDVRGLYGHDIPEHTDKYAYYAKHCETFHLELAFILKCSSYLKVLKLIDWWIFRVESCSEVKIMYYTVVNVCISVSFCSTWVTWTRGVKRAGRWICPLSYRTWRMPSTITKACMNTSPLPTLRYRPCVSKSLNYQALLKNHLRELIPK